MITFYVYHVPQYVWSDGRIGKIGCTKEPHIRFLAYKGLSVQILEEHEDGWLAGDREKELQKEYGYPVDIIHYMVASNMSNARTPESYVQGVATKKRNGSCYGDKLKESGEWKTIQSLGGKKSGPIQGKRCVESGLLKRNSLAQRQLTFEQAQEIRAKYIPFKYTHGMLAKEYNASIGVVKAICQGRTYND